MEQYPRASHKLILIQTLKHRIHSYRCCNLGRGAGVLEYICAKCQGAAHSQKLQSHKLKCQYDAMLEKDLVKFWSNL